MNQNRIRDVVRRSFGPRRRHGEAVFPLSESLLPVLRRPCLAVGVGPWGEAILAEARSAATRLPLIPLPPGSDTGSWRGAIDMVLHHAGAGCLVRGADRLEVLVVGRPGDIAGAWHDLETRFEALRKEHRLAAVILEVGPDADVAQQELPGYCLGRFRLARDYTNGRLSDAEWVSLAARLLRRDLASHLVRFSEGLRAQTLVVVGAALGWLPEVPIGRVLGLFLEGQLARALLQPGALRSRRVTTLFNPSTLAVLQNRLRPELDRQTASLVARLRTAYRNAPVAELTSEPHAEETEVVDAAADWCAEVSRSMMQALRKASSDIAAFPATRAMVRQVVRALAEARSTLQKKQSVLAARRRRAAELTRAQDARRLERRGRRFSLRPILTWWATRRLRPLLLAFGRARTEELLARRQGLAVERLKAEFEALDARLTRLLDEARGQQEVLEQVLRPDHPSLLALQDGPTLEAMVRALAESFLEAFGRPGEQEAWARALPGIFGARSGEKPWAHVREATASMAAALSRAAEPLASPCRGLLPRYRPATLRAFLARAARPSDPGQPGRPWDELEVFLDVQHQPAGAGKEKAPGLPGALCFRWQS